MADDGRPVQQARDAIDNQERIKEQVSHTLFMLSTMSGVPIASKKLEGGYNFTLEELASDLMSLGVAIQLGYDQDFTTTKDGVDLDDLRTQLADALARAEAAEMRLREMPALRCGSPFVLGEKVWINGSDSFILEVVVRDPIEGWCGRPLNNPLMFVLSRCSSTPQDAARPGGNATAKYHAADGIFSRFEEIFGKGGA